MASGRRGRPRKSEQAASEEAHEPEKPPRKEQSETCPACLTDSEGTDSKDKDNWIRCDACKVWYHWVCAGTVEDSSTIDKWFCADCLQNDPKRAITLKAPTRKSDRKRPQRDYAGLNSNGVESDPQRYLRMMEGKPLKPDKFKRMKGADVGLEWLEDDETAMTEPIVIETPDGLGMKMPSSDFTVEDVVEDVGDDVALDVIDVGTQSASPGWTLGKWADYWALEQSARQKIHNVISLEISSTRLADRILPPRLVREIDWVDNFWPSTRKGKGHAYPKVQLYCLMGVASAWTDWHVDFAGSSVYYHIVFGEKIFYFIRPTPANLNAYERWSGSEIQSETWLGDLVDEVIKVRLTQGNTMIIPTGWIHAVQTPVDTLVFGGNFLHSYNVATQLKIRDIEIATSVPRKFRFPLFNKLCWYVADKYLRDLKASAGTSLHPRVATSLSSLADFLVTQVRLLEWGDEAAKKEVRDQIPHDRVKDASAVARELRWRLRLASGILSEDEGESLKSVPTNGHTAATAGRGGRGGKRKRSATEEPVAVEQSEHGPVRFKNFKPKIWDRVEYTDVPIEQKEVRCRRPKTEDDVKSWEVADGDVVMEGTGEDKGIVVTTKRLVTKVRRTKDGLEKDHVERVREEWKFS